MIMTLKNFLRCLISAAVVSTIPTTALAVPVVPNFTQGSMTSHTETTSTVTETINSIDYRTGWEYSVTGVGVSNNGGALNPNVNATTVQVSPAIASTGEVDGATGAMTSSFDSLDMDSMGNFTITDPGGAFQFTQTYSGPGMTNQTIIQRVTEIESVTETTSTFTQ